MAITNAAGIPTGKRPTIKAICEKHGPQLDPDYPTEDDGQGNEVPKASLTNAETAAVFEAITRRFWRDLIVAHEADEAAEVARLAAVAANAADPFA
jgi:hypothetical protein